MRFGTSGMVAWQVWKDLVRTYNKMVYITKEDTV